MSKLKHNKKRNVGIIYELLVRNMTRNLISENLENVEKIKKLIERHFHKNTELYKEYKIFNALSSNDFSQTEKKDIAKSIIEESKRLTKKIDTVNLEKEKSKLIRDINYKFGKKFYFEHVPNYVNLATIQIAINEWKKNSFDIEKTVMLEQKLIDNLLNSKKIESYEELKENVDNQNSDRIVMNIMTKKLNEKYSNMSDDQKNLIKSYAFYYESNKDKLKSYLSTMKSNSITLLENFKHNEKDQNSYLISKVDDVMKNIQRIDENKIDDETIIKFLTLTQLINELKEEK